MPHPNYSRNASKHALEDSEKKVGDLVTPHRWCTKDTLHAKVIKVADVFARGVGEGQRVPPEEPLERYNAH